jgi:hypothetical protein
MNTETPTPTTAAELLNEWKKLKAIESHPNYARDFSFGRPIFEAKLAKISTELDSLCKERGIDLVEGSFIYTRKYFSDVLEDGDYLLRESCDPTYSQELRSWLLMKGCNDGK